ncbi:Basic leucine-zipper 44 [Tripterygium wilfordii]|uniref:Basic leucine-zipper 44 n=1 Tax=Tripterygium wilfordii TaxID=458696 RepID=A0A7J7DXP5_TRIWF|nr:bZIP transcription factor 11-like [Tripterygium wilfordii]KAF5751087.1 Basic leucine-zipper 44 [Tripterygium wilfordii]
MGSSSGTSSGSSLILNSGPEEELQALIDQRKRKRMISNRESARRSRMRKQKLLDDKMALVAQLKEENHQIITSINISRQHYLNVEAENSILRAQAGELSHRLQSLNEIVNANNCGTAFGDSILASAITLNEIVNANNCETAFGDSIFASAITLPADHSFLNPMNLPYLNQPIMASADHMFNEYY